MPVTKRIVDRAKRLRLIDLGISPAHFEPIGGGIYYRLRWNENLEEEKFLVEVAKFELAKREAVRAAELKAIELAKLRGIEREEAVRVAKLKANARREDEGQGALALLAGFLIGSWWGDHL